MARRLIKIILLTVALLPVGFTAQAQQRPYRGTFQSVRQIVRRVETRSNLFRNDVQDWISNATVTDISSDQADTTLAEFVDSARRLRSRFDRRQATTADVQDVLNRAARIDDFVRRHTMDTQSQTMWSSIRGDLNQLANAYNLTWQTSSSYPSTSGSYPSTSGYYPPTTGFPGLQSLTGTYRLDRSRSDDPRTVVERTAGNLSATERDRLLEIASRRLDPPEDLAIDVSGRSVTMASTRAAQVTFDADGRDRVETSPNGRTIHSRAWVSGNQLTVDSTGDRGNEFHVAFQPLRDGGLSVVRRIYSSELNRTVEVHSTYQKVSSVARFDIYNPQRVDPYPTGVSGNFIVPDGTRIVGMLNDDLSSQTARVGDRFTLRVTEPNEFQDAVIEGHVSSLERSGRLTGRSIMTLDFDSIRLSDGRNYQFAGLVEEAIARNGETVRVDTEGALRDQNQTTRTEQRAAIGTAVGAIIGAIAGGGKGAAIGAIVGAGAGAGSIYVEGRNDLMLDRGSELVIRAGAPSYTPR